MLIEGSGFGYSSKETPIIIYLDKCREIGMTRCEIEKNIPYLDRLFHKEIYGVPVSFGFLSYDSKINELVTCWCQFYDLTYEDC